MDCSVILEDAASYLSRTGLSGRHSTVSRLKSLTNGNLTNGQLTNGDCAHYSPTPKVLVISSNDKEGVSRNIERLTSYLATKECSPEPDFLNSLAYTLSTKRSVLPWKTFAIASSLPELTEAFSSTSLAMPLRSSSTSDPRLAFVFTGQGAQWHAMGQGLSIFPAFKASMDASEKMLRSDLGCPWSLSEELSRGSEEKCSLRKTDYSQPACTAVQIALVDLLRSWGVNPVAVVGHSSGEIAAAYCAGLISHATGMKVAWLRGQVSATVAEKGQKGGMLAVSASGESLQAKIDALTSGKAIVGCFNSPNACTISGDAAAVDELEEILKAEQITCTRLPMDVAYHSFHMESVKERYEVALAGIPHIASEETIPSKCAPYRNRICGESAIGQHFCTTHADTQLSVLVRHRGAGQSQANVSVLLDRELGQARQLHRCNQRSPHFRQGEAYRHRPPGFRRHFPGDWPSLCPAQLHARHLQQ